MRQISLTMPEVLFKSSMEQSRGLGYRNLQEFILELVRQRVLLQNIERWRSIEERMKRGVGVHRMRQSDALRYLESL